MRWIRSWWPEAALVAAFVLITVAAAMGWSAPADEAVRDAVRDHQWEPLWWVCRVLNFLGQGSVLTWVLAGGLTVWLLWRTRDWRAALPWASALALTYLTLGPIKILTERGSPNFEGPDAVAFFNEYATADGYALSYPSGHVVNTIVWWGVIVMLLRQTPPLRPVPGMRLVPPIVVFCTTVYLGHHWLTDNLGAVALGLLIDRVIHRWFAWPRP